MFADMPRYFFHLFNDENFKDDEGQELANAAVALQRAVTEAREIAAESVRNGKLNLGHHIQVVQDDDEEIGKVTFREAIQIKG